MININGYIIKCRLGVVSKNTRFLLILHFRCRLKHPCFLYPIKIVYFDLSVTGTVLIYADYRDKWGSFRSCCVLFSPLLCVFYDRHFRVIFSRIRFRFLKISFCGGLKAQMLILYGAQTFKLSTIETELIDTRQKCLQRACIGL